MSYEEEDLRMEVEDLNDMLSDLGFKGLNFAVKLRCLNFAGI